MTTFLRSRHSQIAKIIAELTENEMFNTKFCDYINRLLILSGNCEQRTPRGMENCWISDGCLDD